MNPFQINQLDHVAINVKEMEVSIAWYQKVLGLKKYKLEKWGGYPVFMLAGKTGVAIFPANSNDKHISKNTNDIKIDHFAFKVSNDNFTKAMIHFTTIGINYKVKDHFYFQSVYTNDPDGHIVELTTLMVDEKDFY